MLKQRARTLASGLLTVELGLWALAFQAARALVAAPEPVRDLLPELVLGLATWTVWSRTTDLARSQRTQPPWRELRGVAAGAALVGVVAVAVAFAAPPQGDVRLLIPAWVALGFAATGGLRTAIRLVLRTARIRGYNYRTIAIVGTTPVARRLAESLRAHPEWGQRLLGFVVVGEEAGTAPVLGRLDEIRSVIDEHPIDEVVFAATSASLEVYEDALAACDEAGVSTRIVLDFFPHHVSQLALEELDGFPLLAFHATNDTELALLAKRAVDIGVSLVALIAGAPIFAACALLVKASGEGPVLFVQRRVGLHGRPFDVVKFRTMVADAEARQADLADQNEVAGPAFKLRDDPRVTRVGRWLRRTSLDEIPQFWNVLRGEMSVVGPRPPLPSEVERYERWQRRRLSVKPGITCIWQVSGRSDTDFDTWMRQDLTYIDNWSLWLDLKILVWTIPAVILARGAR